MDCLPSAIFQYLSCPALVSFTMKVPIINSPHIPPIEKHVSWCFCCVCCMCIFRSPYCSNEKGPGVIVIVFFLPCPMVVTVTEGIQETYINIIIIQITKCLHESSRDMSWYVLWPSSNLSHPIPPKRPVTPTSILCRTLRILFKSKACSAPQSHETGSIFPRWCTLHISLTIFSASIKSTLCNLLAKL